LYLLQIVVQQQLENQQITEQQQALQKAQSGIPLSTMSQPRQETVNMNPIVSVAQPKKEITIQSQVLAQTNTINVNLANTTVASQPVAAKPQQISEVGNSVKIEKPL